MQTLAVKYRPKTWDDVTEQESIKIILKQQIDCGEVKNAYLFCGGAGTGKTTCARIFANEINQGKGNPIEMDAASNSGVEDVRNISQQARAKSIDSEYKIFIIDECHAISNTGWQAFLKLIEEPPAKSIFIFCTTDPQKIPKTILSRVQRYDFKRISQQGIVDRLMLIADEEKEIEDSINWYGEALEYIAKIADGGMRDAISLMDKCLSFNKDLTLKNVIKALGTVDYQVMMDLTDCIITSQPIDAIKIIENIYADGKDIKQFVNQYVQFLLDVCKYCMGCDFKYLQIPGLNENKEWLDSLEVKPQTPGDDGYITDFDRVKDALNAMMKLNADIKWSQTAKYDFEAAVMLLCEE